MLHCDQNKSQAVQGVSNLAGTEQWVRFTPNEQRSSECFRELKCCRIYCIRVVAQSAQILHQLYKCFPCVRPDIQPTINNYDFLI